MLAPLFIWAFARFAHHRDPVAFRPWLIVLLVTQPIVRAFTLTVDGHQFSTSRDVFTSLFYSPIHTHADGLLIGLLLANLADNRRPTQPGRALLFLTGAVLVAALGRKTSQIVFDFSGSALIFGSLTWLVLSSPRFPSALFGSKIFFVISRLSYGMYLNHQLILEWITPADFGRVRSLGMSLSVANASFAGTVGIASIAGAAVTYCLIEWPFLRLRDQLLGHRMGPPTPPGRSEVVPSSSRKEKKAGAL